MPDKYLTSFIDELPRMDNDSLLRTLVRFNAAPGEYRPVAVAAARAEMERRGLAAAQLNEAARHAIQEVAESIVDDAVRLAEEGRTIAQIQTHLKARGLDDLSAAEMAKRAWDMPTDQRHRAGRRNMTSGATLCLAGLLLTALGYFVAASSTGGGPYAIFWGIVLVGVLQFLRGVGQFNR